MRVGINLCWLVPGTVGGSEHATMDALRALAEHDPDLDLVVFALDGLVEHHPDLPRFAEVHTMPVSAPLAAASLPAAVSKPLRVAGEWTWLAWAAGRAGVDVFHDAGGTSPGRISVPRVLTVHDVQPLDLPGNFNPVKAVYLAKVIPPAVRAADVVAVPSDFVRDRVIATAGAAAERVHVVPWSAPAAPTAGAELAARAAELRRQLDLGDGPLVVQAGITYPHKGHVTTIRAFDRIAARHPDARLVLVGGTGPAERTVERAMARTDAPVVRVGRLERAADVLALIAEAAVVSVPSTYEGFGLPALEAMALDTPVIVADAGSLPEVVGDGGILIPPGDDAQLAVELHHLLSDPEHRDLQIAQGRARAAHFSSQRTADALAAVYRMAAQGR